MGDDDFLKGIEEDLEKEKAKNNEYKTALATSTYNGQTDPNLIEVQIEASEMLGKLEHFFRGDYITTDTEGNEYWAKQLDSNLILFNDLGVNALILILGNYIDKLVFLSYYDEERINEMLGDLGDKIAEFIYNNYEKIGMDTNFKKTRYELTVLTIIHAVESAFRRALGGRTATSINESRIVTQSDNPSGRHNFPVKKKFNLFKLNTW